jgi:hypothetical protein
MTSPITGKLFSYSNNGMRSNNPRTANAKLFAVNHALAARFEEEGFPIETRFESDADVAAYLGAERIVCLRCGKPYKTLAMHLVRIHGWTADQYKQFYGLPWRSGLSCVETKSKQVENGKRSFEEGFGVGGLSDIERKTFRDMAHRAKHRPHTPSNIARGRTRFVARNGGMVMDEEAYDAVLCAMTTHDITAKEALALTGKPSMTMFYKRTRIDAAFQAKYHAVVDSLSFATQHKCQMLGNRFSAECMRLRADGMLVKDIAAKFNVNKMTVVKWTTWQTRSRKQPLDRKNQSD